MRKCFFCLKFRGLTSNLTINIRLALFLELLLWNVMAPPSDKINAFRR